MLYVAFFMLCRAKLTAPFFLAVLSIVGTIVSIKVGSVGRGFHSFFMGGLCFYIVQRQQGGNSYSWSYLAACIAAILLASFGVRLAWAHLSIIETLLVSVAFPALIVALALSEHRIGRFSRHVGWIGNISYSSYLLHFPLQLTLVVVAFKLGIAIDYSSPLTLLLFMTALVGISLCSFYCFEQPSQRYLRQSLLPRIQPARGVMQ